MLETSFDTISDRDAVMSRPSISATPVAGASLVLLLACLLWSTWQGPDIFFHLYLGHEVVHTGSPNPPDHLLLQQPLYRNIYWLFQTVVYGAWALGGVSAVTLLFAALWFAVLVVWARTVRIGRYPATGMPLLLVTILVSQTRFDPRPETVSYLLLALQVSWLTTWPWGARGSAGPRHGSLGRLAALAATEVLWVNMHAYFVLGPAVVGARLVASWLGREDRRAVRELGMALAVTLAASLLSPFGLQAWRLVGTWWVFLHAMGGSIREFGPAAGVFLQLWTVEIFWALWAVTALATAIVVGLMAIWRRRLGLFAPILAVAGLYLSAIGARNLPLLPLLAAPLWREALVAVPTRRRRASRALLVGTATVAVALALWTMQGGLHRSLRAEGTFGTRLLPHAYPLGAVDYLQRHGARGRLFNSAADGGYLELTCPELQVYTDARYTEAAPVLQYFAAFIHPDVFREIDAAQHFDGALVKLVDSGPLVIALLGDPGWRLAYGDLHRVLFARRNSAAAAAWPDEPIRFDAGEDLSRRYNGIAAIQWTAILVQTHDRARLLAALAAWADATVVPSTVIQYALQYSLQEHDADVFAAARALAPRMLALRAADRLAVTRLLGHHP